MVFIENDMEEQANRLREMRKMSLRRQREVWIYHYLENQMGTVWLGWGTTPSATRCTTNGDPRGHAHIHTLWYFLVFEIVVNVLSTLPSRHQASFPGMIFKVVISLHLKILWIQGNILNTSHDSNVRKNYDLLMDSNLYFFSQNNSYNKSYGTPRGSTGRIIYIYI